jgi:stalled ribosome rescue protein Dom34
MKTKMQFGVWMDTHDATVVGYDSPESDEFAILGHVHNPGADNNSNENASNNQEKTLRHKYFKEIGNLMVNAEEVHLTGTGIVQEQFTHFLADTPQFKNVRTTDCTSKKMSDDALLEFFTAKFQ